MGVLDALEWGLPRVAGEEVVVLSELLGSSEVAQGYEGDLGGAPMRRLVRWVRAGGGALPGAWALVEGRRGVMVLILGPEPGGHWHCIVVLLGLLSGAHDRSQGSDMQDAGC